MRKKKALYCSEQVITYHVFSCIKQIGNTLIQCLHFALIPLPVTTLYQYFDVGKKMKWHHYQFPCFIRTLVSTLSFRIFLHV